VRFSLPVLFGVNATVTFEHMETRRPVPRALFEVPADYARGAYVERGFLRQM